jgi:hypothetical protein
MKWRFNNGWNNFLRIYYENKRWNADRILIDSNDARLHYHYHFYYAFTMTQPSYHLMNVLYAHTHPHYIAIKYDLNESSLHIIERFVMYHFWEIYASHRFLKKKENFVEGRNWNDELFYMLFILAKTNIIIVKEERFYYVELRYQFSLSAISATFYASFYEKIINQAPLKLFRLSISTKRTFAICAW